MKKLLTKAALGLALMVGGLTAAPAAARADHYYASYHREYRTVWVRVAYTAYDHCGYPYTAYKWVPVRKLVKVYNY
jgi:hypothetical protein